MAYNEPKSSTNRDGYCVDSLVALVEQGPLWDGNVPSKSGRDQLIEHGYAVRVVVEGEEGFTAATMLGVALYCAHFKGGLIKEAKANRIANNAIREACRVK